MDNLNPYDICKYAIEHNDPSVWVTCLRILMSTLERMPNIKHLTESDINFDEELGSDGFKEIWRWMLDEYKYQGKQYRSQMLETDYFKNYNLQDTPRQFIRNIPTNSKRSFKYYTGIMKYSVGSKEKTLIKRCLLDFYNKCLNNTTPRYYTYSIELTPLNNMYISALRALEHLPRLTQQELSEIFNQTNIPNDLSNIIGSYLGTQQAGKKTKMRNKRRGRKTRRRQTR